MDGFLTPAIKGAKGCADPNNPACTNGGGSDVRPDPRPDVRENAPQLGDITAAFDFNQAPRPPMLLPVHPQPGPASVPGT